MAQQRRQTFKRDSVYIVDAFRLFYARRIASTTLKTVIAINTDKRRSFLSCVSTRHRFAHVITFDWMHELTHA